MKKLQVGDKVVCIEPTGYLVLGEIYTIKSFNFDIDNVEGVMLEECVCTTSLVGYRLSRFYPKTIQIEVETLDIDFLIASCAIPYDIGSREYNRLCGITEKIESQIINKF